MEGRSLVQVASEDMAEKREYSFNRDEGSRYEVECLKCATRTTHHVMASVAINISDENPDFEYHANETFQVIQCLGCRSLSFRHECSDSEHMVQDQEGNECEAAVKETVYPPRSPKSEVRDARFLPNDILRVYRETLTALNNRLPVLTALGFRGIIGHTVCPAQILRPFESRLHMNPTVCRHRGHEAERAAQPCSTPPRVGAHKVHGP
jgi:hypothetical protein